MSGSNSGARSIVTPTLRPPQTKIAQPVVWNIGMWCTSTSPGSAPARTMAS